MCWEDQRIARKKYVGQQYTINTGSSSLLNLQPNPYRCGISIVPLSGYLVDPATGLAAWVASLYQGQNGSSGLPFGMITPYGKNPADIVDYGAIFQNGMTILISDNLNIQVFYVSEICLNFKNELD